MQLSKRLLTIAHMVTAGNKLVDIGTDHGYIPIYLVKEGIVPSAIAMDINAGPIERADTHIREAHLENKIQTRLSDGLDKYVTGEGDTILIAGMGGALTVNILSKGREKINDIGEIILSPQSENFLVRRYLNDSGFKIVDEKMVYDDGKYYTIMRAVAGCENHKYEAFEEEYGYVMINSHDEVLIEYLAKEYRKYKMIAQSLEEQHSQAAEKRLYEISVKLDNINKALSVAQKTI